MSFGTFPVSQQNTPKNKKRSLNTKSRNTTDARKFLQNFSELKLLGSSKNEADENSKFLQLLNTDNKSAASNNRTINNFDLPFATEIFDSSDGPSVDPNNFSEFPSRINSVQPSGKIDFAQFINGKNNNSAPSSYVDDSLDLEFGDNSAESFDLSFATGLEDSLDKPSVDQNNFSELPLNTNSAQPSVKFAFAQFLNGKNSDSSDEALYQPTVNHNDRRERSELANIFDRSILSSCFSDQVGLKSDKSKSNCKEPEHNYLQYLNKNLKQ